MTVSSESRSDAVRSGAADRPATRSVSGLAVIAGVVVAAAAFRWWAERRIVTPWYQDEFRYAEAARFVAEHWSALVRDFAAQSYLYPRLIAPAWTAGSMSSTYAIAKLLNVFLITAAVVPLYLWARRVVPARWSVVFVALVLALPTGLYAGALVTENAFFPAFLLVCFLLSWMLERPAPLRQVATAAAALLACAVRPQGILFIAIIPTAVALKAIFELRQEGEPVSWRKAASAVRPYLLILVLLIAGAALYALRQLVAGQPLSGGLGMYGFAVRVGDYSVWEALKWTVYQFGGIAIAVAFVPLSALILLVSDAFRRAPRMTPAERAFVAVGASATFWLVVQVGIFASRWSQRMSERYFFHAEPLLLLALVVWINRGCRRPRRTLVIAALTPVALVLALPLEQLVSDAGIVSDAFALIPLSRIASALGGLHAEWFVVVGVAAAAGVAIAVLPRKLLAVLLPGLLFVYLVLASLSVLDLVRRYAIGELAGSQIDRPSWVDDAVGRGTRTDLLYTGNPQPELTQSKILLTEFWNRSVRRAYPLAPVSLCCVTWSDATIDLSSGVVEPAERGAAGTEYAMPIPDVAEVVGDPVARANGLTLYRPRRPLRLRSVTSGVYPDGWVGGSATYDRFTGDSREIRVVVSRATWAGPDRPARVAIAIGRLAKTTAKLDGVTARRSWTVHSRSSRAFMLRAPRAPYRVVVTISPTFSPSQFGVADPRRLGAHVFFRPSRR
jgi:hypothetical protein